MQALSSEDVEHKEALLRLLCLRPNPKNGEQGANCNELPPDVREASPELQSRYREKHISRFKFLICEMEVSKMIC